MPNKAYFDSIYQAAKESAASPFDKTYYVDGTNGDDGDNGRNIANPFATIQAAMDAVTADATRGRSTIYVAPGGYSENIITPLNTIAPFGRLIAANPTRQARGAVWLSSPVTTSPVITVRARGWLVDGFEIDAPTTDGCVQLDGTTSDSNPKFFELANCLMVGANNANDFGLGSDVAAPLSVVRDCTFYQFGGEAITCTDFLLKWEIMRSWFEDNQKHIAPQSSKGFQASWIHDCNFADLGAVYSPNPKIDMRGGSTNHIGPNNLLGGTYSEADGYYAGAGDFWRGNHSSASENGTAQANPA